MDLRTVPKALRKPFIFKTSDFFGRSWNVVVNLNRDIPAQSA